jgi:predicted dehydrogenase
VFGRVENEDVANALVRFEGGATGVLAASRVAWGRKNRLAWEIHGTEGSLAFDQERLNELQIFVNDGPEARGFRRILTGPLHPPYAAFCPSAGHGLAFGELKTIEAAQFLRAVAGQHLCPSQRVCISNVRFMAPPNLQRREAGLLYTERARWQSSPAVAHSLAV